MQDCQKKLFSLTYQEKLYNGIDDNNTKKAGTELCQAQVKFGLANPTVASHPTSQLNPIAIVLSPAVFVRF